MNESLSHLRVLAEAGAVEMPGLVDGSPDRYGQVVLEIIEEAEPDYDVLAEAVMDDAAPRPPTRWYQEMCGRGHRYTSESSTLNGRECCARFAQLIQARVMYYNVPSEHVCPSCGTKYMLKLAVRSR